jgi:multidrug efflux system membrane fusion protein
VPARHGGYLFIRFLAKSVVPTCITIFKSKGIKMKNVYPLMTRALPLLVALATAGLAAATLAGCGDATGKTAPPPATEGPPVSAATVLEKAVAETQEFSGRLEAIDVVQIRPRVSGFITAVNFKPGAEVKKGDVLFEIDSRPFQAEADRAEAASSAARAKADLARLELARAERLLTEHAIASTTSAPLARRNWRPAHGLPGPRPRRPN